MDGEREFKETMLSAHLDDDNDVDYKNRKKEKCKNLKKWI